MKKILACFLCLFTYSSYAWTLASSSRVGFQTSKEVNVIISTDTCSNAGLTPSSIQTYSNDAVTEFWNSVSTSSLKLNVTGSAGISLAGDTIGTAVNKISTNTIIVGCNQNAAVFTSANILAVGGIGCAGTDCAGAVILNDTAGTNLASVDKQTVIATIAHELGHAIGLGHTSVKSALMYYDSTGVVNKSLHQDDIDAVTYLYPNEKKLGGLTGACGTINDNSKDKNEKFKFLISVILGFIISFALVKILKKAHLLH